MLHIWEEKKNKQKTTQKNEQNKTFTRYQSVS